MNNVTKQSTRPHSVTIKGWTIFPALSTQTPGVWCVSVCVDKGNLSKGCRIQTTWNLTVHFLFHILSPILEMNYSATDVWTQPVSLVSEWTNKQSLYRRAHALWLHEEASDFRLQGDPVMSAG